MPTCASRWLRCWRPAATFPCFASAEDFLASGVTERPACALIDLRLPGMSGLDLQKKLHDEQPHLPVVVVTGHGDVATARAALLPERSTSSRSLSSRRN